MRRVALRIAVLAIAIPSMALAQTDLRRPAGKEWLTIGGDWSNSRYSTLTQINRDNVKDLKAAWVVNLGSGIGTKYSMEGTPIVKDGVMYFATGNDDVYALDAKTGALIWEHRSGIDQNITTVCCGWANRGVAVADGKVFLGQLDGTFVALDAKTGNLIWQTPVGQWQDGYTIVSAPLYYNGVIYTGISGGDRGVRGKLTALDAKTGKELWHWWTVPGPGEFGSDTWPSPSDPDPDPRESLSARRRHCLADAGDRSRSRPHLFQHRPARPQRGRQRRQPAGRQSVQFVDRRAASRRHLCVAFPAGAARPLGLRLSEPGGAVRPGLQRRRPQGHRGGLQDRLGLHSRPHQWQAADRHRGQAGRAGAAQQFRGDAALSGRRCGHTAMRAAARGMGHQVHLRTDLGYAGPAGAGPQWRRELGTDVLQPADRILLRDGSRSANELDCARQRQGRAAGIRSEVFRHADGDRFAHQQDRLAEENAVFDRPGQRNARDCERPAVPRRA